MIASRGMRDIKEDLQTVAWFNFHSPETFHLKVERLYEWHNNTFKIAYKCPLFRMRLLPESPRLHRLAHSLIADPLSLVDAQHLVLHSHYLPRPSPPVI
jgi:hypothetical protein